MLKLAKPAPARLSASARRPAARPSREAAGQAPRNGDASAPLAPVAETRAPGNDARVPPTIAADGRAVTQGRASIAVLQSQSLPALVQLELERMILAGQLAPGDKLNEEALAEQLGVSRGPVREAFRALEQSGLVRLEKNRGVRVRQVPVEEANDIYELRAVLDRFAVERVAQTASAEVVRELRTEVAQMEKAALRNDVDTFFAANVAFHDRLVELAGNAKLLSTYRRLVNELRLFRRTALAQGGALPVSAREHRAIVERIAARDREGAGRAIHAHVMASRERMHNANPSPTARAHPQATPNARGSAIPGGGSTPAAEPATALLAPSAVAPRRAVNSRKSR